MSLNPISRNDPCKCGSGKKFKHCCVNATIFDRKRPRTVAGDGASLSTRIPSRASCPCGRPKPIEDCCLAGLLGSFAADPDGRINSVTIYGPRGNGKPWPHPPYQKCKVFITETRKWKDACYEDVKPGQEFIVDGHVFKKWERGVVAGLEGLDAARIPDADRSYDPANWRAPKLSDVVLVLGEEYPNCGHWLLGQLKPGQRCLFQGRVYAVEAGGEPGSCVIFDVGLIAQKRPPELPRNFGDMVVRETEVVCAPMPAYYSLQGTTTPPTPKEFYAKYDRIQNGDPIAPTEVIVYYDHPEPFGNAEVEVVIAADEFLRLAGGESIHVLELQVGMEIRLKDGAIGKVTRCKTCFDIPRPPREYQDGLWSSRVIGRVKHHSLFILEWKVGGVVYSGTPGHIVWSVTRNAWVLAMELKPGELVRPAHNVVVPVDSVGPLKAGLIDVYGIEVEFFHNYFVGEGENAILVHNGMGCVNTPAEGQNPGGLPGANPLWGRNRLVKELHDLGFVYQGPTRSGNGLMFANAQTGEQIRLMPSPSRQPFRSEPSAKFEGDWYYRYMPGPGQPWGSHVSIPNT